MKVKEENIIPFEGINSIKLLDSYKNIINILKNNKIEYKYEYISNKGCTPDISWSFLHIDNCITLAFACNKLWEIKFKDGYEGKITNNIYIGLSIDEALKIDKTLKYDSISEEFISDYGYFISYDLSNKKINSITIFIKEVLDEELFYTYNWAK